jgi:hypothetical protein
MRQPRPHRASARESRPAPARALRAASVRRSFPAAARPVAAAGLSLAATLAVGGCSMIANDTALPARTAETSPSAPAAPRASEPAARPSAPVAAALTAAQAQAALVTQTDLGEQWTPTAGAATWRDGRLKATSAAKSPDCQKLLDLLYAEEPFGADAEVRARAGLDDTWTDSQVHEQIVAGSPEDVDRTLEWLGSLPRTCAEFTASAVTGVEQQAKVTEAELPGTAGDARQGLRLTLTVPGGEDQEDSTLTVDLAVVRVGDDTFVLTHGGLGEVSAETTYTVAELGAQRLTEVRKQARLDV